jgi:hypothetical protein
MYKKRIGLRHPTPKCNKELLKNHLGIPSRPKSLRPHHTKVIYSPPIQ